MNVFASKPQSALFGLALESIPFGLRAAFGLDDSSGLYARFKIG